MNKTLDTNRVHNHLSARHAHDTNTITNFRNLTRSQRAFTRTQKVLPSMHGISLRRKLIPKNEGSNFKLKGANKNATYLTNSNNFSQNSGFATVV